MSSHQLPGLTIGDFSVFGRQQPELPLMWYLISPLPLRSVASIFSVHAFSPA